MLVQKRADNSAISFIFDVHWRWINAKIQSVCFPEQNRDPVKRNASLFSDIHTGRWDGERESIIFSLFHISRETQRVSNIE